MANEASLMFEVLLPIPFICANATGIEEGAILQLTDPFTALAGTVGLVAPAVAGIAAAEKIASDGVTTVAVYRTGIFKVKGSGNITVGNAVVSVGAANLVQAAAVNDENILGVALETSADAETLLVELCPFGINLA